MAKAMKKLFRKMCLTLCLLSTCLFSAVIYTDASMPNKFWVTKNTDLQINNNIPVTVVRDNKSNTITTIGGGKETYNVNLKLFGVFPVKTAQVAVVDEMVVIPCGTPFGIKMFTDGVLVVGLGNIETAEGTVNPAKNAGLRVGDVLVSIDGKTVNTNEEVADIVSKSNGKTLAISIRRKNINFSINITPVKSSADNQFKAGIWVRDSSAGIGTVTFYNPSSGILAGLGHAVCDIDTNEILPIISGEIVEAKILGCNKGQSGTPGELRGSFSKLTPLGTLLLNSETGVFGKVSRTPIEREPVNVALKQEVKAGKATIFSTVDGSGPKEYEIEIEKINYNEGSLTKNMVIKIVDPDLLSVTGGIVQGMSGSPIMQNGKLIGAVTHVFVNDPTRGYAIFAENMLNTANGVSEKQKNAS